MSSNLLEEFDYSTEINSVKYHCKDCEKQWDSRKYLESFEDNYSDYDGYVKGDWTKIIKAIIENLFRPKDRLQSTVCPECSTGENSGQIAVNISGSTTDKEFLEKLKSERGLEFSKAVSWSMDMPDSRIDRK